MSEIESYEYIMRIDDESQVAEKLFNVFQEITAKKAVYMANIESAAGETILPEIIKLKSVAYDSKAKYQLIPKQPEEFNATFTSTHVKMYYNNFEVIKVSFFKQDIVSKWINVVDATDGIFYYRWGDAILRYTTLVLFATKDEVLHRIRYGLGCCHPC